MLSELSKGFIERRFFKAVSGDDMLLYNTENLKRQYAEKFNIDENLVKMYAWSSYPAGSELCRNRSGYVFRCVALAAHFFIRRLKNGIGTQKHRKILW